MAQREHNIQNEIRAWCGQNNILCFRCNVGRVQCADGTWFDTGLPEGFSDLIILPGGGRIIFCEVKTRYGQQRQAQVSFQNVVEAMGYKYIVARSVDNVRDVLYNNTNGGDANGQANIQR